jgi:hypothetical protein
MNRITEKRFGKGAHKDRFDSRDYKFSEIAKALPPFDWDKGFDIEEKLGLKLPVKNQGTSGSCGGQAWSYYGEVLEALNSKTFEERSAKFIYAQTAVPGGGSAGRENCNVVIKQGWAREQVLSSYENGQPPSEEFISRSEDITSEVRADASNSKALKYAMADLNIEAFAQAIKANNGLIMGIQGRNNGTWLSMYPKAEDKPEWAHWMYLGKAKVIDGKKFIGALNSWGDQVGEGGWQWFGEEWFQNNLIFNGWTIYYDEDYALKLKKIGIIKQLLEASKKLLSLLTRKA